MFYCFRHTARQNLLQITRCIDGVFKDRGLVHISWWLMFDLVIYTQYD